MIDPIPFVQVGQRLVLGSFFAISGTHKLFVPEVRDHFRALFNKLGVSKLWIAVGGGELAGGLGLMTGTLTPVAALGLIVILFGAIELDVWNTDVVGRHPRDPFDWVAKTIYCPEVLMTLWLMTIMVLGAGPLSIDAFLRKLVGI